MIKISVIIPVYNVEKYLSKCLDSVINQSLKDIEIIVINDGSIDNSKKILMNYMKKDSRIILINQKNSGQGIARNKGIDIAKGEYISFIDSDDYIDINMLEDMYKLAKKEMSDLCICGQTSVNENGKVKNEQLLNLYGDFTNYKSNINLLMVNMGPCNKIYSRKLLINNKLKFPENKLMWYEDLPFVATSILKSNKVCWINKSYYNYLQRNGSTMNNSNIKKNMDIIDSFNIVLENCKDHNMNEILEFLCIEHVFIYTSTRIIKSNNNMTEKKKYLAIINKYINERFPNYKTNKFIKHIPIKRRIMFILLNLKLYNIIMLIFKMKDK